MAAPADYDLTIIHNGVDITTKCPFDGLGHDDNQRSPSYFSLVLENPSTAPALGDSIIVIAKSMTGAPQIFNGFIMSLTQRKRSNSTGTNLIYELECGDNKVRLQKAVVPYATYTGLPSEIIADMFANAYPSNLSNYIDFSSAVDDFATDLNFETNDESLLDALNRFADRTGGNFRLKTNSGDGDIVLRFTSSQDVVEEGTQGTGGATPYWYSLNVADYALSIQGGVATTGNRSYSNPIFRDATLRVHIGGAYAVSNISFDVKVVGGIGSSNWKLRARYFDGASHSIYEATSVIEIEELAHIDLYELAPSEFPFTPVADGGEYYIEISVLYGSTTNTTINISLDNVVISSSTPLQEGGKDQLVFQQTPDPTDFDFDIDTSDEFGSDFDLSLGAFDDFNSVTVVGGNETIAIDEALEWDGTSSYMKLPFKVRSLAVYKNTGSDTTPSWTAQALGIDGTDDLTSEGGSKDVLHNATENFLYFDTEPANMTKAVRITGFREKPLRIRVENIGEDESTFATTVYNDSITTEEDAIAYGNSLLARKNAPRKLEFETYEPGLKVGQEVTVTDSARGMAETLLIHRIQTKWIGPKTAEFSVECGEDDFSELSSILAGVEKKADRNSPSASITTPTITYLYDTDDTQLTDTDGGLLYESS